MRLSARLLLVGLLLMVLMPQAAWAQDANVENARKRFDAAQKLYDKGDFAKAAVEFMGAHAAKPFAAFLFNAAVCYEKSNDSAKAIATFQKYLAEAPKADDRADVKKRIAALKKQATAASGAVLPAMKTKGVVMLLSRPTGATIYLDRLDSEPIGTTPWNGTLTGTHTVIFVLRGYDNREAPISPGADQMYVHDTGLVVSKKLGWLELRANVANADVYLDRKDGGAVGRTPFRGNIEKGKHTLYVSKPGYKEVVHEIEIKAGEVHNVNLTLEESQIGFVRVRGTDLTGAKVTVDGDRIAACPQAPCRFELPEGGHTIKVSKSGKKSYKHKLDIASQTETVLRVKLADSPSRLDAAVKLVIGGGLMFGGYFVFSHADDWGEKVNVVTANMGMPRDRDLDIIKCNDTDPAGEVARNTCMNPGMKNAIPGGPLAIKITAGVIVAGAAYQIGQGIYFLVREKGPPSTGSAEARDVAWTPVIGPGYAGLDATIRF